MKVYRYPEVRNDDPELPAELPFARLAYDTYYLAQTDDLKIEARGSTEFEAVHNLCRKLEWLSLHRVPRRGTEHATMEREYQELGITREERLA